MPLVAFSYRFKVRLPLPADAAYRWATDYRPDDLAIMGEDGRRTVEELAEGTLLLTDTIRRGKVVVTKTRLVRLIPERRSWTNTHLAGPTRHSQFLYTIVPRGRRASRLEFTGLQVEPARTALSRAELAARARKVRDEDATLWRRHLVRAMAKDLRGRRAGPRRGGRRARRGRQRAVRSGHR